MGHSTSRAPLKQSLATVAIPVTMRVLICFALAVVAAMAGPEGYQYPQPSNPLVIPVPTEPPTEPPPSLEYLPPVEYLPPIDTSSSDNFDSLLLAEPAERQPQVAEMTKSEMEMLLWDYKESIPGLPETDYPILERIPETGFSCDNRLTGYYADVDTRCQVFHVCTVMPEPLPAIKNSFLCPNGTMFNQENFACQWWADVNCPTSERFFALNANIGVVPVSLP